MFLNITQTIVLDQTKIVIIKRVDDVKYLGAFIMDSYKNFKTRKALAWQSCNALDKVWRSNIDNNLKIKFFTAVAIQCWLLSRGPSHSNNNRD